ncbi:MAG: hypothetical protein R3224_09865 [Balneolaceae bacterium]|nr:hypothetical protein [Balneolaceae bacterium]
MDSDNLKRRLLSFLKKWWCSLLLLPFVYYSVLQIYWTLRYNIFFIMTFDFPFPINIVRFLIDNFLLIVHEAGHTFFSIFGVPFITILGGSLFEILLPLGIVVFTWINGHKIGMQFSLFLLALSWFDVAAYAADGGARQLPLIGGLSKESHDWFNLLYRMDMLPYDIHFGVGLTIAGVLCCLLALLIPALITEYEDVKLKLKV